MVRNTSATRAVLEVFVSNASAEVYGLDAMRETGLASGSLYPILGRLETEGMLTSRWEDIDPHVEGRPARRLYSITGDGVETARRFEHEVAARRRQHQSVRRLPLPEGGT